MVITDSEWKLMELLWEQEPLTIMQMTKSLQESTGWTKHTIISFLKRMEEKDVVFYEDTGKAKRYYTLISKDDAVRELVQEFIEKAASGNAVAAVEMFLNICGFSEEEKSILQDILSKKTEQSAIMDVDYELYNIES